MSIRPIDADALLEQEKEWAKDGGFYTPIYNGFQKRIQAAPTLDYAPVRHGEWKLYTSSPIIEPVTSWAQCSECSTMFHVHEGGTYAFCPSCGAKMDGGKKDG